MVSSADMLTAIREISNAKQLDRAELHGLLENGIFAALAKRYGPTVQAEVDIDEDRGEIRIVRLRNVVAEVTDDVREIALDDAKFYD
jgi:N utilization substance protein A